MNSLKVLIVDDNVNFLKTMEATLRSKGCSVKTVRKIGEALSLLLKESIDIVFIDSVLRSEQGLRLVQQTKKYLGTSLDVVMMSGVVSEKSISSYICVNDLEFVKKPLSDSYLERRISQVKERLMCGEENQFLLKLFSKSISVKDKLKYFLSVKQSSGMEFLLTLAALLDSKESGVIKISFEGEKTHEISFSQGSIYDYNHKDTNRLLNFFLEKGFLKKEEAQEFQNTSYEGLLDGLIQSLLISSYQVILSKIDLLNQLFNKLVLSSSVSFQIELFIPKKGSMDIEYSQDKVSDFISNIPSERLTNTLYDLFEEKVLNLSLEFKSEFDFTDVANDLQPLTNELKTGLKLKTLFTEDKDRLDLYKKIICLLAKGGVYFSDFHGKLRYGYLYERYKKIYDLLKTEDSNFIFELIGNKSKISNDHELVVQVYKDFMSYNHPDKLLRDLPEDLLKMIREVLDRFKYHYDRVLSSKIQEESKENEKNKLMQKTVLLENQKKSCGIFLEKEKYKEAHDIIKKIDQENIEEDVIWQMFYLWLSSVYKEGNYDKQTIRKYLKNVFYDIQLKKNHIYHYVLGVYYESEEDYEKAIAFYGNTKKLKPSFQPVYKSIKNAVLKNKNKKEVNPLLQKIQNSLFSKKTG